MMVCEPTSEATRTAKRKYMREMGLYGLAYLALVFGGAFLIRNVDTAQWLRIVLALLPVAPALMMLRAFLTYLNAMDEFQRRLQTDALLMATGIVVFGSFAYGFLEEWADLPHVPLLWVFPVFSLVFGVAHLVIRRRYK